LNDAHEGHIHNNLESLGWDELVSLKRKLYSHIKELTNNIIDIERNQLRFVNENIHKERNVLNNLIQRSKQIRTEIQTNNSQLFSLSEKISQSKNFLGMMEYRIPSEKEEELIQILQFNQKLLDDKEYKNERQRNDTLTLVKDASMKIEAIKAVKTIKDQLARFRTESDNISKSLRILDEDQISLQTKIAESNNNLDRFFDSKRHLSSDHEKYLNEYNETIIQLDRINARLNVMAEMRQKQRQEYGHGLPDDALFKVKETAKKKLESGSKLTFEEFKQVYSEKGQ
jgi:chromosome segregation ATPase